MAKRIDPDGPAAESGLRRGEVLVAVEGTPVQAAEDVRRRLDGASEGDSLVYQVLREQERRALVLDVAPLPRGHMGLYYFLAAVGIFSLLAGTTVYLRRRGLNATAISTSCASSGFWPLFPSAGSSTIGTSASTGWIGSACSSSHPSSCTSPCAFPRRRRSSKGTAGLCSPSNLIPDHVRRGPTFQIPPRRGARGGHLLRGRDHRLREEAHSIEPRDLGRSAEKGGGASGAEADDLNEMIKRYTFNWREKSRRPVSPVPKIDSERNITNF